MNESNKSNAASMGGGIFNSYFINKFVILLAVLISDFCLNSFE